MSDNKVQAIKALNKAQSEMQDIIKTSEGYNYMYADLHNVMEAVIPALSKNGFAFIQPSGGDELGDYVETILLHESGFSFKSRIYLLIGAKKDMQTLGSAMTYARRYGLLGMAGVAPIEDDDGKATVASFKNKSTQSKGDF